jgi:type VI secretion system protein ImpF
MARTELDRAVQPSLLDRLTDEQPKEAADRTTTRDASERAYRMSVQRDVEFLLNTRCTMIHAGIEFPELRHSVHQYGLPDTSGLSFSNVEGRQELTENIAETLRRFEPRLMNVVVKLTDANQVTAPQVRFSIAATLRMDPSPEQIVFDTVLEIASGTYDVAGGS